MTTNPQGDSFLHDIQKEGRATGKIAIEDFETALAGVSVILNKEVAQAYHEKEEEDWPTSKMEIYCHECQKIVPAGIGNTQRGNPRTICGVCSSKKISMGRHEALQKFYHIEENQDEKKN